MLARFLGQSPDLVTAAMSRLVAGHHVSGLYVATATWTSREQMRVWTHTALAGASGGYSADQVNGRRNRQHTINGDHDWY